MRGDEGLESVTELGVMDGFGAEGFHKFLSCDVRGKGCISPAEQPFSLALQGLSPACPALCSISPLDATVEAPGSWWLPQTKPQAQAGMRNTTAWGARLGDSPGPETPNRGSRLQT